MIQRTAMDVGLLLGVSFLFACETGTGIGEVKTETETSETLTETETSTATDTTETATETVTETETGTETETETGTEVNHPPTAPEISIEPASPLVIDDLHCHIETESTDADGDVVSYDFLFLKDGNPTNHLLNGATADQLLSVAGADTAVGEEWRCQVTPHDGTDAGASGEDVVTIAGCMDLNQDCFPDISFSYLWDGNNYQISSRIYWGSSNGFVNGNHSELPTQGAIGNIVADLNNDGFTDIVYANSFDGSSYEISSYIYWGSSAGFSVANRMDLPTLGANDVAAHDLDGDGFLDLVFANSYNGSAYAVDSYVYWGSASGFSVANRTDLPTKGARSCALADLNADGFADIVFANGQDGTDFTISSYVYWGSASGFSSTNRLELPTQGAQGVSVSDLNGDGLEDLVFANSLDGLSFNIQSYIYWNSASGFSENNRSGLDTLGTWGTTTHDLDSDGYSDVVFAHRFFNGSYNLNSYIYWGESTGVSSTNHSMLGTSGARATAAYDLNRDGHPDLVFANIRDSTSNLYVDSMIYWGSNATVPRGGFSTSNRTGLPTVGAAGVSIAAP